MVVDEPVGLVPDGAVGTVPVGVVGARVMAEAATCEGGVLGRPVDVVAVGAGGSPLASVEAVSALLERGPAVIVGPSSLEVGLRVGEVVDGRVPVLFPRSVDPALAVPSERRFLLGPDGAVLGDAAAGHVLAQSWRRAVVVLGESAEDELVANAFASALEAGGGVVVSELGVGDGGVDPGELLDAVEPASPIQEPPDVVFVALGVDGAVAVLDAMRSAGVELPVVAVDRRADGGVVAESLDGLELVGWPRPATADALDRFAVVLAAELGTGSADRVAEARTADAVLLAIEAVARAATDEPTPVASALAAGVVVSGLAESVRAWPVTAVDDGAEVVTVVRFEGGVAVPVGSVAVATR